MSNRLVAMLITFGFLLFLVVAPLWSFQQVEDELAEQARAALGAERAGKLTFAGRNGYLRDDSPESARTAEQASRLPGVRNVQLVAVSAVTASNSASPLAAPPPVSSAQETAHPQRFVLSWDAQTARLQGAAPAALADELSSWNLLAPTWTDAPPVAPRLAGVLTTLQELVPTPLAAGRLVVDGNQVTLDGTLDDKGGEETVRKAFANFAVKLQLTPAPEQLYRRIDKALRGLGPVEFEFDSTEPTLATAGRLEQMPGILAMSKEARYRVIGHADSQGSVAYNQALSEHRAEAIKQALLAAGLSAGQLHVSGEGESSPLVPNDSAEQRQRNRRVELSLQED